MRAFSTRIHAVLDYALAAVLIGTPWIVGFEADRPAMMTLVGAGVVLGLYALVTDFEMGAVRRLQMPLHLWLDGLLGVVLAISPWLLEFDQRVRLPHLVAGAVLILVAVATDTIPGYERRRAERAGAG